MTDIKEAPVWDSTALYGMFQGKEEYVRQALHIFFDNLPSRIKALETHIAAEDTEKIRLEAHSIKGSAAAVGGHAMRSVALEIENAGREADIEKARILIPELLKRFVELKEIIKKDFP